MFHYKAFSGETTPGGVSALEVEVNAWLAETKPLIHTMKQTQAGVALVVSFLYETDEEQARASVATATAEASVGAAQPEPADALMITLLPQMELPY
ncbi:MAG: hypothetical protein KGO05_04520 [Chloroflexota bacterium]|nr:hypothetical protein [Chloroflexota bacterium]